MKPIPLADSDLQTQIFAYIENLKPSQVKMMPKLDYFDNPEDIEFILLAKDVIPLEILGHFVYSAKQKNIPYIFVDSGDKLGKIWSKLCTTEEEPNKFCMLCFVVNLYKGHQDLVNIKEKIVNLMSEQEEEEDSDDDEGVDP